jgi:hypothetical protein
MRSPLAAAERLEYLLALRAIRCDVADQHEGAVDLLAGDLIRIYHAPGVFPSVEA